MAKVKQLIDPKMLHQIINPTQPVAAPIHPIHRSISTLDRDMQNILQRTDLSDEEKIHQYNQILQRYLQYQDHLRAPNIPPPMSITKNMEQEVLSTIPKTMRRKAENLLERVKRQSNLGWNERGELLFNGEVIQGTNIVDLVNDMVRQRKSFQPHGWREFARALRQDNVPQDLIGNKERWDWMHRESATSDGFSTAVESTPTKSKRKGHSLPKTPARERSRTRRDGRLKTESEVQIDDWNDWNK